jgi:peptidoglycan/LPS O-acetylase OafA/YrhL
MGMSIVSAAPERQQADHVSKVGKAAGDRFYRPELDVLRFAAFLCVFACHSIPAVSSDHGSAGKWLMALKDAGNFGVCIFFLLSSYLITELLRREILKTAGIHLKSFYVRRILRIWPLYFTILIAYLVLGKLHPSLAMESGRTVANLLLVGNWYIFFHPFITSPLRALWSISVEEQFYLAWPTIAKLGGLKGIAILSGVLILLSMLTIGEVSARRFDPSVTVWVNSFVQFQFFSLGALVAFYLSGGAPRLGRFSRCVLLASGPACWLLASGLFEIKRSNVTRSPLSMIAGYEVAAIGTVLIFIAVLGMESKVLPKSFIYLGKISYGLYVFHETGFLVADNVEKIVYKLSANSHIVLPKALLFMANKTVALAATIALAMVSYRFLETPFLNLKRRFTSIRSRSV